jgi:hypothetical protein
MIGAKTGEDRTHLPYALSGFFGPIVLAIIGSPYLLDDRVPSWLRGAGLLLIAVVWTISIWHLTRGPRQRFAERQRERAALRENAIAIKATLNGLGNALSMTDVRCVYSVARRLANDKVIHADSLLFLGAQVRALSTWQQMEINRLSSSSQKDFGAIRATEEILRGYISVCRVLHGSVRSAKGTGYRVDESLQSDWSQVAQYANDLIRGQTEVTERVNARRGAFQERVYFEAVSTSL